MVGGVIALLWTASQASGMTEKAQSEPQAQVSQAAPRQRENAVLVFGATGRLGTAVVSEVVCTSDRHLPVLLGHVQSHS